jgi:dsRNA-specific ribonuclease
MDSTDSTMTGFLASHEKYVEFREFISRLLSTFMDDETREIYMSEKALQVQPRQLQYKDFPKVESHPIGLDEKLEPAEGPFAIIRRAFTHAYLSDLNMESLETLGDGVLNEAVTMIIVCNWPNLLLQPSQVANMKKYHTNNVNIAMYAQKLGFIRWIVRHPDQGLDSKERADIFESFIGAIVLIGEFYIGSQMGLAYARLFLDKFFATEEWHPESPEFYEVSQTLYNDWCTSLPAGAAPKSKSKIRREDDGTWRHTKTISDSEKSKIKAVTSKTGVSSITFTATARKKDDAEHAVMMQIAKELNLSRADINKERDKKRAELPDISAAVSKIVELGKKMNKDIFVTGTKKAARHVHVFVKEKAKARVGGRELYYERFIVNGTGDNELQAIEDAYAKMARGEFYKPVAGFDYEIWNPDEAIIGASIDRTNAPRQINPFPVHVKRGGEEKKKSYPGPSKPYNTSQQKTNLVDNGGRGRGRGMGRGRGTVSKSALPNAPSWSNE